MRPSEHYAIKRSKRELYVYVYTYIYRERERYF